MLSQSDTLVGAAIAARRELEAAKIKKMEAETVRDKPSVDKNKGKDKNDQFHDQRREANSDGKSSSNLP